MILTRIIEEKRKAVDDAKKAVACDVLKARAEKMCLRSSFKKSISRPHHINLIAEIKKASPSKGILRGDFNPVKIAVTYQANGASAVSVVTDERFFDGKLEYIAKVKEAMTLPVLRKDFIIDEYQIYESVAAGADAILLIAELLSPEELASFHGLAVGLGLDVLVEVHTEEDLDKAAAADASIIGINNRDLHTFKVDLSMTQKIMKRIPPHKVIVSESGIKTHEDVMFLKSLGVNAILVGEAFMEAGDISAKIRDLMRY